MLSQNALQAMVDGLNAQAQKERSGNQMTLGGLIAVLNARPPEELVYGLGELMSYRGYYCDLAFDPTTTTRTVADLLAECRGAMGKVFEGYKGGDFLMGASTPLWIAAYGDSGCPRLMGLTDTPPYRPIGELEP